MTSELKTLTWYCCASIGMLLVLALWPFDSEKLLVVMPVASASAPDTHVVIGPQTEDRAAGIKATSDQAVFSLLSGTNAQVLTKLGDQSFIVTASGADTSNIIKQLYQNGAFLVLNAAGLGGCGNTESATSFRRHPV